MEELAQAGAALAHQVASWDPAVVERQRPRIRRVPSHLPIRLPEAVAGSAVRDHDVRDLAPVAVPAGHGRYHHHSRDLGAGIGDELLGSVDHPLPVLERGAGVRVTGIGAGLRLGQSEGAQLLAATEARQPLLLLLGGSKQVDGLCSQRGVRAQGDRHRGVNARQLLYHQHVRERVAPRAAVLGRERDPHQIELCKPPHDLIGKRLRPVELLRDGGNFS